MPVNVLQLTGVLLDADGRALVEPLLAGVP
jgi:hypothetical protein